jgi:hypothetical protein
MHIDDDHLYYGSALIQIAEDPHFTAINAVRYKGRTSRCGFRINKSIGVHIHYRSKPQGKRVPIYTFAFSRENLVELRRMSKRMQVFLALVCVKNRAICCLPYADFLRLIHQRRAEKGYREDTYTIEVWVGKGHRFRVGISTPGTRRQWADHVIIPRTDFPRALFRTQVSTELAPVQN